MDVIKPDLIFAGELTPITRPIKWLVQHHMAHPSWDLYDVHEYHKYGRGWFGIGYNYWIGFSGDIYEGRGFHIGGHARGYNEFTLGIGYQGDFMNYGMTNRQLWAGIQLNKYLMKKLGLTVNKIVGHNHLTDTLCPGRNFRMKELRKGVSRTEPKVVIKGEEATTGIIYDKTLYIVLDTVLVPVRVLAEGLNLSVKWEQETRTVYLD